MLFHLQGEDGVQTSCVSDSTSVFANNRDTGSYFDVAEILYR